MRTGISALLLASLACPVTLAGQNAREGDSSAWQYDRDLPSGTVSGTIFGSEGGTPMQSAVVRLVGRERVVITDSLGRFELQGVAPGEHTLQLALIGYRAVDIEFLMAEDAGVRIHALLRSTTLGGICGDLRDLMRDVRVTVVAARTGEVPEVPVRVSVLYGDENWSRESVLPQSGEWLGTTTIRANLETPGQYTIRVEAEGFQRWQQLVDFRSDLSVCEIPERLRSFQVRLQEREWPTLPTGSVF